MWGTLTGLYVACLAMGFIYSLVGAIFGELGSHGELSTPDQDGVEIGDHDVELGDHDVELGDHDLELGDHDVDLGDQSVELGEQTADVAVYHADMSYADMQGLHVSPLNSITIATFVGSFGAMGLIGQWGLKLGPMPSLAFAIPMAVVAAGVQFVLYVKVLVGSSGSSEATLNDVLNCTAEVITGIPEAGVGEIAYDVKGFRYTAPARSADGTAIKRGARVRVLRSAAGVMQVREF